MIFISKLLLSMFMIFCLAGCGETCEHENTVTMYTEGKWLDLNKSVNCEDCKEEVEGTSLLFQRFFYFHSFLQQPS